MIRALAAGFALLLLVTQGLPRPAEQRRKVAPSPASNKQSESDRVARRWLGQLSLKEQVGQLVMIASFGESPSSRSAAFRKFSASVRDLHVGGIIVNNRVIAGSARNAEPHAMAAFLNRMQRLSKIPLLVGGDFERGASMRVAGTPKYPHQMAFGAANDTSLTRALGETTAAEARALGVHWIFAPDADVNNNPENPIINTRSFGEDPGLVSRHVTAFIQGAHANTAAPVLVTAKHFPGHGDTSVDSHAGLPSLAASRERMETLELVPFRAAIRAGVDAIMSAHMSVPALGTGEEPATVSPAVLTTLLREDLQFKGLAVTDAMDMAGLAAQFAPGEAAVRALEAGADLLLIPPDPAEAIAGVMKAVRSGRLTRARIAMSALRVLEAKVRVRLHRTRLVDVETISDKLEDEGRQTLATQAAERALTLVRNDGPVLPLQDASAACVWILSESRGREAGRELAEAVRLRSKETRIFSLDQQLGEAAIREDLQQGESCKVHIAAAFTTTGAFRGDTALRGGYDLVLKTLTAGEAPFALIAVGSPYLLRAFPDVDAALLTFSSVPEAETAAVRAVFGEIPIQGRTPVTIPGIASAGDGIQLPKR